MTIDMSQFYQVFFDEADELLAEMEKLLLALDVSAPDSEDLNAIFRSAHSIKGGAATFGFADITEVTHVLESLLDRIRKGEMALTAEHVDAFLASKDVLAMLMNGHRHGEAVDHDAVLAFARELLEEMNFVRVETIVAVCVNEPVKPRAVRPVAVDIETVVRVAEAHRLFHGSGNVFNLLHRAIAVERNP